MTWKERAKAQRELHYKRVMAFKMMTVLGEGKIRRDRILEMHKQMAEQNASFPILLEDCRNIDLYFNKASIEFPFLHSWTLRAKGKTYYISHIETKIPWSSRELPSGPTRGMIRFKKADIHISEDATATIG